MQMLKLTSSSLFQGARYLRAGTPQLMKMVSFLTAGLVAAGTVSAIAALAAASKSEQSKAIPADSTLDSGHTRYSPLAQITPANVDQLKPVWVYDTGSIERSWEETPIEVEGVIYLSTPGGAVALDPETGKELWRFSPVGLSRPGRSRGVAYWPGDR